MGGIKLGKDHAYGHSYDASLLEPIKRQVSRADLLPQLEYNGIDVWTSYELSWLYEKGMPQVAMAEFIFPASNPNIIESKSFKYYLNSLNQTRFKSRDELVQTMKQDLSKVAGGDVYIRLYDLDDETLNYQRIPGRCLDHTDMTMSDYKMDATRLLVDDIHVEKEAVYSHLLRSNCPVTGQPDWATIWVRYSGQKINDTSLLQYFIGYRLHEDFHESCIERIFNKIQIQCKPNCLEVYARYTRRGGLDINPYRTSIKMTGCDVPFGRLIRQ